MLARKKTIFGWIAAILLNVSPFQAQAFDLLEFIGPTRLSVGPEIYHLSRRLNGGTHQSGTLYGGQLRYDRLRDNSLYLAARGRIAKGDLIGSTGSGDHIKSVMRETEVEGRIGWSFGFCLGRPIALTPYGVYGHFHDCNHFKPPSPLTFRFRDQFDFGGGGMIASVCVLPDWQIGVDFRAAWMYEPKAKLTDDVGFPDVKMSIDPRWLYMVEVPISYDMCWCGWHGQASLVPFWERRTYGGFLNFPFDFLRTRYTLTGARFLLSLIF